MRSASSRRPTATTSAALPAWDTLEAWYWRLSSQTLLKLSSKDQGELAVIKKARRNTALMFAEEATEKGKGGRLMSARSYVNSIL
jgi:hypothetical protein